VCKGSGYPDVGISNVDNTDNQIQANNQVIQKFVKQA
jgi:hypothetical protein